MTDSKFDLRRCFTLCLPALIIGALLRISLVSAVPEALFGSDSSSYFKATQGIWSSRHRLEFPAKRRWLYPILLMPLPALPMSPVRSVAIIQHLVGLMTIFGIGWITGHLTRMRALWVPLVTTVIAIWPKLIWYEHEMVAEVFFLGAFVLAVGLAMPAGSLKNRDRLFWFLLAAALVASIKPHGRGIWFGCVVAAGLAAGTPWKWGAKCWAALAAAVLIIFTSGEAKQGKWLLLNSTLPLVNLDNPKWQEYRNALKPMILKARSELDQYAWTQERYKKPLGDGDASKIDPVWANLERNEEPKFVQVCDDLSKEAVLAHPLIFAKLTFTKIGISLASDEEKRWLDPALFWQTQEKENAGNWPDNPRKMKLVYSRDQSQYNEMVKERVLRRNPTEPFLRGVGKQICWLRDIVDKTTGKHRLAWGWMGVLATLGFLVSLMPSRFVATSVLWFPAILCLVTVHAVGDRNSQYVQPIEWVGVVLIAIGLDALFSGAMSLVKKKETDPVPEIIQPG